MSRENPDQDGWHVSGPAAFLAVALAYLALAQLVVWLNDPVAAGAGLWPAAGVTLGALLLLPRRSWGWVVAAVVVAEMGGDLAHGYGLWASAGWTLGNVVEPLVGASLLAVAGNARGLLTSAPNLLRFIVCGVVAGPLVGATIGTATTVLTSDLSFLQVWPKYVVGDALGVLVVCPAVLSLRTRARARRSVLETIALVLVSLATSALVFVDWAGAWMSTMPYLLMPCLAWAALRFGVRGVSLLALVITLTGNAATAYGDGPFARAGGPTGQSITMLQVFLAVSVACSLLLAVLAEHLVEQRVLGDQWRHEATHDPLTGLANRAYFERALDELLAASTPSRPLSVVMCDVDGLKGINDTWGHAAGDVVLRAVAQRMRRSVRPHDVVARISGDEFVLLLPGAHADAAVEVADRVLATIKSPVTLPSSDVVVPSVSLGVATRGGSETAADLLRQADDSLYRAKSEARGRLVGEDPRRP